MKTEQLKRSIFVLILLICSSSFCLESLRGGQIRSWDSSNQRGGDLFNGRTVEWGYSNFETMLLDRGHSILPGLSTLNAAGLSEVDVFFWGTSEHQLTPTEAQALDDFVRSGGCLILETNSILAEGDAANAAYTALGLGVRVLGFGDGNGVFQDVVSATTVGPLGDLRGQSFATTFSRNLDPTGHTLVGVSEPSLNSIVEFLVGEGMVLGLGDPYGFNLFDNVSPNNLNAYLNFIENCITPSSGPLQPEILIKPGGSPNSINCRNDKGVITVAILTTLEFDATEVDHETVRFEGAMETHINKRTGALRRHEEDVDGDGDTDLVLHFRYADTDLTCESEEATLTGSLFDGTEFAASGEVRMVPGTRVISVR